MTSNECATMLMSVRYLLHAKGLDLSDFDHCLAAILPDQVNTETDLDFFEAVHALRNVAGDPKIGIINRGRILDATRYILDKDGNLSFGGAVMLRRATDYHVAQFRKAAEKLNRISGNFYDMMRWGKNKGEYSDSEYGSLYDGFVYEADDQYLFTDILPDVELFCNHVSPLDYSFLDERTKQSCPVSDNEVFALLYALSIDPGASWTDGKIFGKLVPTAVNVKNFQESLAAGFIAACSGGLQVTPSGIRWLSQYLELQIEV